MFHLAPLNQFFLLSPPPPTSNTALCSSPVSPSNIRALNILIHSLFPVAFQPQHRICQLEKKKSLLMAVLFYVPVLEKIRDPKLKTVITSSSSIYHEYMDRDSLRCDGCSHPPEDGWVDFKILGLWRVLKRGGSEGGKVVWGGFVIIFHKATVFKICAYRSV